MDIRGELRPKMRCTGDGRQIAGQRALKRRSVFEVCAANSCGDESRCGEYCSRPIIGCAHRRQRLRSWSSACASAIRELIPTYASEFSEGGEQWIESNRRERTRPSRGHGVAARPYRAFRFPLVAAKRTE